MFRRAAQCVFTIQKVHFSKIASAYKQTLERHPFTVQVIQSATLMGAGDFIAQACLEKKPLDKIDYYRTTQFFCLGLVVVVMFNLK